MTHPRLTDKDISAIVDSEEVSLLFGDVTFFLSEGVFSVGGGSNVTGPIVSLCANHDISDFSKLHSWAEGISLNDLIRTNDSEYFLRTYLDAVKTAYISNLVYIIGKPKKKNQRALAVGALYMHK